MSESEIISEAMKRLGENDQKLLREILMEPHEPYSREQMEKDIDYLRTERIKKEFEEATVLIEKLELSDSGKKAMQTYKNGCLRALKMKGAAGRKVRELFCLELADFERKP